MTTAPCSTGPHPPRLRFPRLDQARLAGAVTVAGLAVAGLAVAGCSAGPATVARPAPAAAAAPAQAAVPLQPVRGQTPVTTQARESALPTGIRIPAIGVRADVIKLGLTSTGAVQVPATTTVTGWYTGSARPGDPGTAVILGHIDSYTGPGIFFKLHDLRPGNLVYVRRADNTQAVFRVYAVRSYSKSSFPTTTVYGPSPDAQLRLITCGGQFDESTGHYLNNVVVYATQLSTS